MQMHEAKEVVQVIGTTNANAKLAEGWTLLAVVSAEIKNGTASAMYVLGKAEAQKKEAEPLGSVKAEDLMRANKGL